MNTLMAIEFLTRCFHPGETIAILLRREQPPRIVQRIVRLEQATTPAYIRWLAHENASGMNVYVAANPLRVGSRKRTKECIAEVRHLYIDIDEDGEARLAALSRSVAAPPPIAIVATSPGRYQVLWQVQGFDFPLQETTLKQLASTLGGDAACTDCNRVIRVPGFHNVKYTPSHPVTVEYGSNSIATRDHFRLADGSSEAVLRLRGFARSSVSHKATHSEQDWAWIISELSSGKDPAALTHALAVRRADKPNPLYYAQRTVDMASARLALLSGTSIDNVVSTLEVRRSAELAAPLCSARAREIAQTAAHIIARRKHA